MEIVKIIAEKVTDPLIDYTVAPIARQVSYLIFYKDNFKNLKDQYVELKRVKGTICHEVEAERKNGRQIYDAVQNWLNRVDEIVEEAEQLSNDPRHRNATCCKGPFPNFKSRHQLSRKAKKMAGNVAKVMQQKDNIGPLAFLPDLEGVGSTFATSSEKLESRKKMKEDIVLALKDPHISRVGVYGLGGVGKSTLVKEVAKQVKDDKLFDEVVMANISQVADLERTQREIADFLGLHFEETTTIGRAARLRQRIKNERSILVILDDIWEIFELDKLGLPLNDHKGCKLLLISRKLDILQKMETQKDFLIGVLNEEEAWSLFEDMVGDVVKDVNLHEVASQVAQKCAGLIVLIVTVARALKNKDDIDSWNDALNQLKIVDEEGMSEKIYSALEFSYNHLDGDDVKALFLLCGSIGPQIQVEYLLRCVMGLGIFKHINTTKDARLKLHRLIGSLKASCLLLEDNSKEKVKMHDIVHEVAVSIASRDQHVFKIGMGGELKKWPSEEFLQRCTQIILDCCHIPKLPERLECPNIKLFYLYSKDELLSVPDSFFAGMKNLKVLDLTCMHFPSLPQSFHSLIDLQTLCLDQCALGDMTNIGALMNLQILSLYASSMIKLPSELGQLIHLRMLDLTDSGIEIFPSNIISKLTKLEELYLGNTSIKWEQEDSDEENKNASLSELRHLTNLTALEIQIKGAWVLPRDIMFDKLERYKIVIGDVWEWSDNYGASKMLKLKLSTIIHLEHGIKELIKGVEDLYLDEVHGISNVLYDLNGEGFPLLKHLHIQNNGKIQHIINLMKRRLSYVFFPKLETLILQNLNILETICDVSFMKNSFARLRSVKVKCCDQLKYLFSVPMVKALCQLIEIEVLECRSIKKIVFVENSFPNSLAVDENIEFSSLQSLTLGYLTAIDEFYSGLLESSTTTMQHLSLDNNVPSSFFNSKVKFSNLETLKLSSINLENIWQDDHVSIANSFHKLANLSVEGCRHLKYLFSSSIVGSFPNLKQLEIRECEMMEEIISIEGRNDAATDEVGLPKLETLVISNMKRLKKVWPSQFDGLKTMEVNNCEKLKNIFPHDMQGTFGSLETLKVSNCGSVEEIFQITSNEIHIEEEAMTQVSQLKKLHLLDLPKLKQIWSKDPQGIVHFHSLQDMLVEECKNIEYLFPFSIAVKIPQLEKIMVDNCGMSEIVSNKGGAMEETVIFHFDRLHSLVICNMSKLDRFYNGNHSLACPSLSELCVVNCEKLKLLGRHCTSNQRKNSDSQIQIFMQRPLFVIEEVIPELKEWTLNNKEAIMILQDPQWKDHYLGKLKLLRLSKFEYTAAATFLDSVVQKAPNLKSLVVERSSLKEIFRDKRVASKEGKNEIKTQLQNLSLINVQLLRICREGCQVDPILKVLEGLYVAECDSLKILVPSSVTFSHLTYLEIEKCNGLINLIYPSTASSLVKVEEMILRGCNSLEEIVTEKMNETKDEIVLFLSLRTLVLESLPRLNCFSSSKCLFKFPFLEKVVVRQCPRMKIFCETETSAPMLKKVIKDGKDGEWCWEGNLNGTINRIFLDKAAFHNSKHLDLSMYPELKDSWYSPVENKMFCNLKSLVVKNCDFISNVLISSNLLRTLRNLEEVDVSHCDSLQVVFEFDCTKEGGMSEKEAIHLRKISLSNLPKLQYIWKQDCQEIATFGDSLSFHAEIQRRQPLFSVGKVLCPNLQVVWVKDCENLEYLFPFYIAMHAIQLEDISIKNARSLKQIVSDKEGLMDSAVKFEFNHLISLELWNLYELEGFFAGNHSLLCPLLRELDIRDCAKLKVFKTRYWSSQGGVFDSKSQVSMQQPLFTLEEVICNLENLVLDSENLNMILQGQFSVENFSKLKFLCLRSFEDDQTAFPYSFLQNITSLEHLVVEWSYFKEIFQEEIPTNEKRKFDIRARIKKLTLYQLHKLQHISKEGYQVDPVLEMLEHLWVKHCSNLKHLVPSSVTFSHLTYLEVENCNGLSHLITSSTARSLVKLTEMKINNCNSLEQVVAEEREGSEDEIAFNSLEVLELECLPMIKRFCSGNCVLNLQWLEKVVVRQCPRMSIFSVKDTSTPMLQEILSKEEDEKIYWEGDLNRTINKMFVDMVAFHSFKHLELAEYPELRELWYNHVQPEVYGNLNSLVVHKCDFLSDVLLPLHLVQALSNLEELQVTECDSLEAVFDLMNMDGKEVFVKETIQLKRITLSCLPKLKHIWKQNFQELVKFRETAEAHFQHHRPACSIQRVLCPNLQVVWVKDCENLEYLFPFYIAMHAIQLEHITINNARSMKQIVSDKEGLMDSAVKFEFNHLISLKLWDLYELEGFFAGNHSLLCPMIRELDIRKCAKLKLFKTRYRSSQGGVFDGKSQVSMQQPLFTLEEVICNLENLALDSENLNMILQGQFSVENFSKLKFLCLTSFEDDQTAFPYWFLQNITSLKHLVVEWSYFKEIFQEEIPTDEKRKFDIRARIKKLTLNQLHKLQHISREGFQIDPVLEMVEYLRVKHCSNLKHLVPSSVTFSHLTHLEVENCNGLSHLITSSTARSLVKLTKMKIKNCNSLEQVVAEDREGSDDEIAFNSLEVLELECLPMIKRFCSSNCVLNLQWLEKVVVRQCPRMSIFSVKDTCTPMLQEILSKEEDEKIYWEGDLNRTINKMFVDMVAFHSFKHLELAEYPELRELWYNHVQPEVYGNLNSLVVHKCDFLSDVLLPLHLVLALSNLEELQVSECDSLEAVFDLTNIDQKEVFVKETIQLKRITLSRLPKLKHIWKQNLQEIVNFRETTEGHLQHHHPACSIQQVHLPNLETIIIEGMPELKTIWHPFFTSSCLDNLKMMQVSNCEKLENIFPSYMQRAFSSLETLMISDCNSVQVIFEFSYEMDSAEKTTHLQQLTLLRLLKLKQIWSRDPLANLGFHNLQSVRVENCENLEYLFPFSIAMHAIQLEDITIRNAGSMKQIVSDREVILDGPFIFECNHLASLVLWKLYELEGFFAGNHSVLCPLLRELDVRQCVRLKLFKTQNTSDRERRFDSKLQISTQQALFTLEEVICNLERLAFNSEDASTILQGQFSGEQFSKLKFLCLANFEDDHATFPYWFLQNITTLNELHVECSSFKEIFQEEIPVDDDKEKFKIETRIEKLTLNQLYDLQHICKEGFQIDPVLKDLEYLLVQHCSKLKQLMPSTVTCSQLAYLEVQNCNGLIHLITSSTAKSLVNLTQMIIRNCNSLEQVVAEDREESKDAIAFRKLFVLELECLPRLKMFCSSSCCLLELPWLRKVVISNCPRMEIFALGKADSPMLKKVLIQKEDEKEQWQGDLDTTVTKIFQDMADQVVDTTKQEIPNLPSSSYDRQQKENASSTDPQDAEESHDSSIGTQEMYDTIKKPSISVAQNVPSSSSTMIPDTAATMYPSPSQAPELATGQITEKSRDSYIETQNMYDTIKKPSSPTAQNVPNSTMIPKVGLAKGTREMGENIERPMVEAAKIALSLTGVCNAEGSHESETCPRENLFNQPKILITCDNNEAVGSQEIRETMDKPLIQSDQHAQKLATTENTEKSRDSYIETQKMCDTIKKPSSPTEQNVPNSTMIPDIAIDPSPSKSPQPMTSTILKSDAYSDDKWLNYISKQNLPYLELGMKRHPQVLDWFDTKRRGVFAAIFTEVTRILRTTRRCDLTEDDQNHIRECCVALEAVGFDASWLNYVYGCIESCGNGDELIRKLEETEAKASTLRNELASVQASLASMRDKASRLHNFIES